MSSTSNKVGGRDVTRSTSNPTFLHTRPGHQVVRSATTGSFLTEDEKKRRSVRYGNSTTVSVIKLLLIMSLCFQDSWTQSTSYLFRPSRSIGLLSSPSCCGGIRRAIKDLKRQVRFLPLVALSDIWAFVTCVFCSFCLFLFLCLYSTCLASYQGNQRNDPVQARSRRKNSDADHVPAGGPPHSPGRPRKGGLDDETGY